MKHLLPSLEHLMRTDYRIVNPAELETIQEDDEFDEFTGDNPVFLYHDSGQYQLLTRFSENRDRPVVLLDAQTVNADDSITGISSAFAFCPLAIVLRNGVPIGYVAAQDMIEAATLAHGHLEAYFSTTLETLNPDVAITLINEEGHVAVWTSGAEHIFSIQKNEIIGKPASDFFPVDRLQSLKTLETGESVHKMQHRPRQDMFVLINSAPVKLDDKIIGAVAAESDLSTQMRLHQELLHMTSKVHHLQKEVAILSPSKDPFQRIKGTSLAIKKCIDTIRKISSTKATVLIQGESGTGKELFAEAIHHSREPEGAPFIAINCGAIPAALFESELFGYERGAFSGADPKGKKGKIELASGGTLFLDEIGEMPLDMQVKMLRVLQEKNYFAVGGTQLKKADCRIIAATNRNLEKMITEGSFREDLYYRLNVVLMDIPALRERKEDIYELTQSFLHEFSLVYGRHIQSFTPDVFEDLLQYDWPGNIRELRNTIERLVIFSSDGEIKREYLPANIYSGDRKPATPSTNANDLNITEMDGAGFQARLDEFERYLLQKTLEAAGGNKLAIAKQLGISRATLYNKLKRLKL
ncbi:sigma 54-interacting transcriptional regulator [Paenibacillus sp.]|jgi:transcriptional regulator with PAS, ATPase and Fis domain|uniref:sigma-54 interaction domain-containing protein n=1 Tax=Paenibacillus sp. TaxID=58172 RepID=UPI0028198E5D|nr:sigma 54-interacting transcriptional regulator [Paenibacillus sp.]MDR0270512.1 sigma 54-interacting transcriptional regulator [Paenibacillus sp.]